MSEVIQVTLHCLLFTFTWLRCNQKSLAALRIADIRTVSLWVQLLGHIQHIWDTNVPKSRQMLEAPVLSLQEGGRRLTLWWSGLTPGSALKDHSRWGLGEQVGC